MKMFSKSKFYGEPLSSLIRYLPRTGKILDAGCGDCFFAHNLKKCNDNILCLDIVHSDKNYENGLPFCLGSISNLPLKSDSIDFIYCITVIQYIPDAEGVINEFLRVLKPQGKLLITVPAKRSMFRLIREWSIYCDVYPFQASFNIRPYTYYTRKMMADLLDEKFKILEFRGYEYNFFPSLGGFFLDCARKNRYFEKFYAKSMTLIQRNVKTENPVPLSNHDLPDDRKVMIPKRPISKISDFSYAHLVVLEKR
jgi:ubiquinone/menaquinone biosynthesis C-methylase UbiE